MISSQQEKTLQLMNVQAQRTILKAALTHFPLERDELDNAVHENNRVRKLLPVYQRSPKYLP